jgi:hypothetical protein
MQWSADGTAPLITSHHLLDLLDLLVDRAGGLVVEVTDGTAIDFENYR